MEPQKSHVTITSKNLAKPGGGKSETVDEERAALVKPSKLPAYLQRRTITSDEEEKKEKELLKKQMAAGKMVVLQTNVK